MISIEEYKPVKHEEKFKIHFNEGLDITKDFFETSEKSFKKNLAQNYYKKCIFNKTILIFLKDGEQIGFCMYEYMENFALIIFDYVNNKHKGAGRELRKQYYYYFKDKVEELKFVVQRKNKLSSNSISKAFSELPENKKSTLEVEDEGDLSDKILYTMFY